MEQCEAAALRGDTPAIKELLGPLLTLKSRNEKIGNILRVSYQIQIKQCLTQSKPALAKNGISHYVDLFGMDGETEQLIKVLHAKGLKLHLSDEQKQHRPRGLWVSTTHGHLPDSIVTEPSPTSSAEEKQ